MTTDERNHFSLLCGIGELGDLLTGSSNIEHFLQRAADMVARHLEADVCSIYLYDEQSRELILKATVGLDPESVGKIRIKSGEGLIGNTFKTVTPICESYASQNKNFNGLDGNHDIHFESFLAVPIQKGVQKIGVLAVQHKKQEFFNEKDMMALRVSASQLAGVIENARLMMNLHQMSSKLPATGVSETHHLIKGESASAGIVFAKTTIFKRSHTDLLSSCVDPDGAYTLDDFYKAVQKTNEQLIDFQTRLAERMIESASLIFSAHFMILKDAKFIGKITQLIMEGISPPNAVRTVVKQYNDIFSSSSHAYIKEKVSDMEDLAGRILKNLFNWTMEELDLYRNRIVIAQELYPSEILRFASEDVKGIVLVRGGVTSHVAILSRSLQIPMVISNYPELLNLSEGTPLLLDAEIGTIYIRPTESIVKQFEIQKTIRKKMAPLVRDLSSITRTRDGELVHLLANINLLSELKLAHDLKAEGIGLYRTEFPFLIRSVFPSEEEQYIIYKRLFDEMNGREVTIRTLDVGGEKMPAHIDARPESNPELGLRSIRFSMRHRDIFEQQIRAILRAAAEAREVKIMFPMISSLDEFLEAKHIVRDCMVSLEWNHLPYHPGPAIGMMVELPSVIEIIHELAVEADFFSIGTNDFIQYMLAVDRTNENVAGYYCPHHPSVLRSLAKIINAANLENKDVSICGEMAHELSYTPFLIGIGVRRFSVDPQFLPNLQRRISRLTLPEAQAHAKDLLSQSTIEGTSEVLRSLAVLDEIWKKDVKNYDKINIT